MGPPARLGRPAARAAAVALLLVALVLAVFAPAARHEFAGFDDAGYITRNRVVARGLTLPGVRWALTATAMSNWHPLTWLSHMLDVQLFGMRAGAHHAVSVALHAAAAALLFGALLALTGARWPAAAVAALFAVHPLHVESVAFAAERKDVLSTVFALLCLLAWAGYLRRPGAGRYLSACGLLALALLAKPMPVSLPFVLLLLDVWPLGRWTPGRSGAAGPAGAVAGWLPPWRLVREKLPLLLLAAASSAVTWYAQARGGSVASVEAVGFPVRAANAAVAAVQYLLDTAWPAGLAVYYPHPLVVPATRWAPALAVLLALSAVAVRGVRSRPWLGVGWLWYLVMLLPVIGLVQVGAQARADRYTYLPLVGVFVAVCWQLAALARRRPAARRWVGAVAAVAVVALGVAARAQLAHWRGPETLFRRALAVTPDNPVAAAQLGVELLRRGAYAEAELHLRRSLAGQPGNPAVHNNLAIVLDRTGRAEEAAREYREAIARDPGYAEARLNLGTLLFKSNRAAEAIVHYREAVRVSPGLPVARLDLALALEATGDWREALGQYEAAVRLGVPGSIAHTRLGILFARQGRPAEAAAELEHALRLDPGDRDAEQALRVLRARGGARGSP